MKTSHKLSSCVICQKKFLKKDLFPLGIFQTSFFDVVQHQYPMITSDSFVCHDDFDACFNVYRRCSIQKQNISTSLLGEKVLKSLEQKQLLSGNTNDTFSEKLTFADGVSDRVADFGGSWTFIISFLIVMLVWMLVNSYVALTQVFDPYPYILLNLVLSCVAALQAPIIMMSQKRQEKKDRIRSEQDYLVNLKAELEIRYIKNMLERLIHLTWHTHENNETKD